MLKQLGAILEKADGAVAIVAEQASDDPCLVVVIDAQAEGIQSSDRLSRALHVFAPDAADSTDASLVREELFVLLLRDAVVHAHEVPAHVLGALWRVVLAALVCLLASLASRLKTALVLGRPIES